MQNLYIPQLQRYVELHLSNSPTLDNIRENEQAYRRVLVSLIRTGNLPSTVLQTQFLACGLLKEVWQLSVHELQKRVSNLFMDLAMYTDPKIREAIKNRIRAYELALKGKRV